MEVSSAKLKYKSSVNLFFAIFFALFQIVILLLLSSKIYTSTSKGLKFGLFLAVVDALVFIPMFFKLGYEIRSDHLYVCDWPFGFYRIPYSDIISVDEPLPENVKHVKKVGLSTKQFPIAYVKHKKDADETAYITISPADKDSFLLFLQAKLKEFSHVEPPKQIEQTKLKDKTSFTSLKEKAEKLKKELKTKNTVTGIQQNSSSKPSEKVKESTSKEQKISSKKEKIKQCKKEDEKVILPNTLNQSYFTVEDDEKKPL